MLQYVIAVALVLSINIYASANHESNASAEIVGDCIGDNDCPEDLANRVVSLFGTNDIVKDAQTSQSNELKGQRVTQLSVDDLALLQDTTHVAVIRELYDQKATIILKKQGPSLNYYATNNVVLEHGQYTDSKGNRVQYIVIPGRKSTVTEKHYEKIKKHAAEQSKVTQLIKQARSDYHSSAKDASETIKYARVLANNSHPKVQNVIKEHAHVINAQKIVALANNPQSSVVEKANIQAMQGSEPLPSDRSSISNKLKPIPESDLDKEMHNLSEAKASFVQTHATFLEVANKNPKAQYTDPAIISARNNNNEARLAIAKAELRIAIINKDNVAVVNAQNRIADIEEASRLSSLKIAEAKKQAIKDRVAKKKASGAEVEPTPQPSGAPNTEPTAGSIKVSGPTSAPTESNIIGSSTGKSKRRNKINKINEEQLPPSLILPMSSRALDE